MADLKISVDMTDIPAAVQATQRFERQINTLASQLARGSISTGTYQKGLQQLSQQYSRLGVDINSAKSAVMSYGRAAAEAAREQQAFFAASQTSSRGMNAMGVGMQQAGYQIGDFLVQVQSGTNAFVAFGQQATQLVGILPMFNSVMGISGTALIGLSAGLGIAIPLLTALGAAFMRTRQNADSASGGFTTMRAAMQAAREESARMADEIDRLNLGLKDNAQLNLTRAIEEQGRRVADARALAEQVAGTDGGIVAEERLRREEETLRKYEEQLQRLKDQAVELDNIKDAREQEVERTRAQVELQDMLLERERRLSQQRLDALLEAGRVAEEGRRTREEIALGLEREAELYRLIALYGEESTQVEAARAQQAREVHEARIRETTTNEVLIQQAMELYDAAASVREEAERNADAWSRVSAMDLGSLNAQVKQLMLLTGMAADEALRYAVSMPIGVTTGEEARGGRGPTLGMEGRRPNFDRDLGIGRFAPKAPRGGGGGATEVDPIERLKEQIRLEQELLGKTEAQQRVIRALGIDWKKYGQTTVDSLVASIEEMDRFNEKVAEQQRLADFIGDSFGDAFLSVIDGTKSAKDAFRSMAADIIKELYRVLVVQRMVGAISNALGSGGSAGGFLANLLKRESGGSMMPNQPYIVGERGPELVIPGRSATVTNADLTRKSMGGSDGLVVNNNITVNGGNDPAAIRMEVAKLMPQITNATKTAVIDARRRGGQMRAAFQ